MPPPQNTEPKISKNNKSTTAVFLIIHRHVGMMKRHKKSHNNAYKITLNLYLQLFFILSKNCPIYVSLRLTWDSSINIKILKIQTKRTKNKAIHIASPNGSPSYLNGYIERIIYVKNNKEILNNKFEEIKKFNKKNWNLFIKKI